MPCRKSSMYGVSTYLLTESVTFHSIGVINRIVYIILNETHG